MKAHEEFMAKAMKVMRIAVLSYTELKEKLNKTQEMMNSALNLMEEAYAKPDPGPFVRPDNLEENEFLIVERNCVEVYTKDKYLPTPMPKDCVATPIHPWISVKERMPEEYLPVLTTNGYSTYQNRCWAKGSWWSGGARIPASNITHWMPIPKPPEVSHD